MTDKGDVRPGQNILGLPRRAFFDILAEIIVIGVILFVAAGTFDWPRGWAFLVLFVGGNFGGALWLAKYDPALLAERLKAPIQHQQPVWDRLATVMLAVVICGWLAIAGLDAGRFGWTHVPWWLAAIGALAMAVGYGGALRAMAENSFLAPVVKMQQDRGQRLIETGPYSIVRHPFYAALMPIFLGGALLLGSWLSFGFAILAVLVLAFRIPGEERLLDQNLPGYTAYKQKVRYRLIPFLW